MNMWFVLAASALHLTLTYSAWAQDATFDERLKRLERGYQELEDKEK